MNYQAAIDAIRAYFAALWGNTTPVAYDDVAYKPSADQPWVRFNIAHVEGFQASTGAPGSNRFRREGLVTASVFTPQNKGGIIARQRADQIADCFIGKAISGITFSNVTIREVGNDGAGWYQINVRAQFHYDRIT